MPREERNRGSTGGGTSGTVRFRCTFHNTIYDVLRARGWKETDSETDWDVAWIDTGWLRENFDNMHLEEHQRLNHFRNHYELTRKDNLIKNLKRTQRTLQREGKEEDARKYDFFPGTYVLPADYGLFVEEFKSQQCARAAARNVHCGRPRAASRRLRPRAAPHVRYHTHGIPPCGC